MQTLPSVEHRKECARCYRQYAGNYCERCHSAFFLRPKVEGMSGLQMAEEIIGWRKAEIPRRYIRRRLSEMLGRSVRDYEIIVPYCLRGLISELKIK